MEKRMVWNLSEVTNLNFAGKKLISQILALNAIVKKRQSF